MPSVAGEASRVVRLLLQKNATFDQEFRETIEPLLGLSSHGSGSPAGTPTSIRHSLQTDAWWLSAAWRRDAAGTATIHRSAN
jgi:hypothetical protein